MAVKNRNPLLVIVFSLVTLGIYALYWLYQTKGELDELTGEKSSGIIWLITLFIPVYNIYLLWQYLGQVEKASKGAQGKVLLFILWVVFFPATQYLVQTELNKFAK